MKPNELKALIDIKFNGVANFQEKILNDKNAINKPKLSELNAIIKSGEPPHLFSQLIKMAMYYEKSRVNRAIDRTISSELVVIIRSEIIKQYGTFESFYLTHDIERSFLDRLVNNRLFKLSTRVENVCRLLQIPLK